MKAHHWAVFLVVGAVSLVATAAVDKNEFPPFLRKLQSAFALAPGGTGAGVSTSNVNGFCEQFASEMVGVGTLCKDGDSASGLTLTPQNAPAATTITTCPNGPNCGSIAGTRHTSTEWFQSASGQPTPTGDFSMCWWGVLDDPTGYNSHLIGSRSAAQSSITLLAFNGGGGAGLFVDDAVGTTTTATSGVVSAGVFYFICGTYQRGGTNTTNTGRIYVNGVEANNNTAMGWPRVVNDSLALGASPYGGAPMKGFLGGGLFTYKLLTPSTVAQMASALLPTVQGTRGETVTTTRASARSCCNDQGCSILPPNKPCFTGGAQSVTNLLLRSEEFENASWVGGGAISTSANTTAAPNGTTTADTVTATIAGGCVSQTVTTTAGQPYTLSAYLQQGTGPAQLVIQGVALNTPTLSAGFARFSVTGNAPGATTTFSLCPAGGAATGSVVAWGAQVNAGSSALPYCATGATNPQCTFGTGSAMDVSGDVNTLLPRSNEIDAATWTKRGTATVTANQSLAPDGTLTADRITIGATSTNDIYEAVAGITANAVVSPSFCIRRVSTSGTLQVNNPATATKGQWNIDLAVLGPNLTCITGPGGAVTQIAAWTADGTGTAGLQFGTTGATVTVDVSWMQLTQSAVALPYCPSAATPTTCNLDSISYTPPVTSFATPGCVKACVTLKDPTQLFTAIQTTGSMAISVLYKNVTDNNVYFYDGVAVAGATPSAGFWVANQRECFIAEWGGGTKQVYHWPSMTTGGPNAHGNSSATITSASINAGPGTNFAVDSIQWGKSKEACR